MAEVWRMDHWGAGGEVEGSLGRWLWPVEHDGGLLRHSGRRGARKEGHVSCIWVGQ